MKGVNNITQAEEDILNYFHSYFNLLTGNNVRGGIPVLWNRFIRLIWSNYV